MKKNLLIFSSLLFTTFSAIAQPVIDSSHFYIDGSYMQNVLTSTAVTSGMPNLLADAGANRVWNYNMMTNPSGNSSYGTAYSMNSGTGALPTTNIYVAWQAPARPNGSVIMYQYSALAARLTEDRYELLSPANQHYEQETFTNPKTILAYPMTYNTTFTDSFYSNYNGTPGIDYSAKKGALTATADAWGSLTITMNGNSTFSYPHVLRVHSVEAFHDTIVAPMATGFYPYNYIYSNDSNHIFRWFSTGHRGPIMSIDFASGVSTSSITGTSRYNTFTMVEAQPAERIETPIPNGISTVITGNDGVAIYPNPATNGIYFHLPEGIKEGNVTARLTNTLGATIGTFQLPAAIKGAHYIDLSGQPAGCYRLSIFLNNHWTTSSFIKAGS